MNTIHNKIKLIVNKTKFTFFNKTFNKSFSSRKNIKFAVLLSGCGVYDGRYNRFR